MVTQVISSTNPRAITNINLKEDELSIGKGDASDSEKIERFKKEAISSTFLFRFPDATRGNAGEGVKIAIIDTGIDREHAAFKGNVIVGGARIVDNEIQRGVEHVQDDHGHGTHCAGIVAARPLARRSGAGKQGPLFPYEPKLKQSENGDILDNESEIFEWVPSEGLDEAETDGLETKSSLEKLDVPLAGVAPKSKLLIYKVTRSEPHNREDLRSARVDDIALAINTAVEDGADIISLSMASEEDTDQLHYAVHRAAMLGCIIIASAGNEGSLAQNGILYPARYGATIAVASHGRFGEPSAFASFGGELTTAAPGQNIWSCWTEKKYRRQTGTSMAAPYVAGVAALLLAGARKGEPIRNGEEAEAIHNGEDLRRILVREMTAHPGWYDPRYLGYGPIITGNYLGRGQPNLSDTPISAA